jgi:C-terminal processing protease CtpA/Prc
MHTDADAMPVTKAFNSYTNGRIARAILRSSLTQKKENGHFTHKNAIKTFYPNKDYPYRGQLYVITNGGSFSAASIFPASMQAHKRGPIIGRETGGGFFGCTAWMIPYVTLPQTKVRLRLPLFRIYNAVSGTNQGRGVMPDYPVKYSLSDVLTNVDLDLEQVIKLKETIKK